MSFIEQLILRREKIYHHFAQKEGAVQLPLLIDASDRILICLPEEPKMVFVTGEIINEYQSYFAAFSLQFCAPLEIADKIPETTKCIYYDNKTFSLLHKFPEALEKTLRATRYKMAIDTNRNFSLAAALVCRATQAPIRISFSKPNATSFFNLILSVQMDSGSYQELIQKFNRQIQALIQTGRKNERINRQKGR